MNFFKLLSDGRPHTHNKSRVTGITGVIFFSVLSVSLTAYAELPVEGYWKSVDEQTDKVTAYWKLEVKDNRLLGYLVSYPDMKPDSVCEACKGELKEFFGQPIKETAWLNLSKNRNEVWQDGYIIDAGKGNKYQAKVWVKDGNLMMRGYIGFFFRTQTWLRTNQVAATQETFGT